MANNLRHSEFTQSSGFSEYQLDKRIKALFGLSLSQYITRERIGLACHKLSHSQTPIIQVALSCGYSDQAAFSRQFKQSVGITPIEYRKTFIFNDNC
ncbi:MAG: helix-turn-helix transcriptional regulator [Rhizobiales bacterium]|nr:helix-turn-helix transcriptional regulator [Hyphomicrobiales bacterium]